MEVGISEPNVDEFAYVYGIKALAKHERFWYTTKWGIDVEGIYGLCNNMDQYKDKYFFYPTERPREFRTAYK